MFDYGMAYTAKKIHEFNTKKDQKRHPRR